MKPFFSFIILFFIVIQLIAELLVLWYSRSPFEPKDFKYVILLGLNVLKNQELATDRVRLASEALAEWPEAKLIITGNESIKEVSLLKEMVLQSGISKSRLIEETQSKDTWDNISFSKKMIPEEAEVLLITNEFHQMRALAIARMNGVNAFVYGRDPRTYPKSLYYTFYERAARIKLLGLFIASRFH